ncbi:MAG: diguanylate cyclase [Gammaproteobacteria bacterium]|nr:diguanylate cyclase [Gammaproteobacteria bacterium]
MSETTRSLTQDVRSEIARLNKIVQALMNRAERSMTTQGSDFGLFQTTILLEDQVRARTKELELALRENEKMTRALQHAGVRMEKEIQERKRAQEALLQSEERYRTATEAAHDAFVTVDEDYSIVFVNSAVEKMFGYSRAELLGRDLGILMVAGSQDMGMVALKRELSSGKTRYAVEGMRFACLHKGGREVPVELSFGEYHQDGRRFFTGVARDITERVRTESLREGQQRVLELIALNAPLDGILTTLLRCIEAQSRGMLCSVGLLDIEKGALQQIVAPSLPRQYLDALSGFRIGPRAGSCGTSMYRREPVYVSDIQSDPLWSECRAFAEPYGLRACWSVPIISGENEVLGAFAMYYGEVRSPSEEDIRLIELAVRIATIAIERKQDEAHILHMARHDALTGLPNRILLEDRIYQSIAQSKRDRTLMAVLFIDLDKFKPVNDRLGHKAGDAVLREAAQRMRNCLREGDSIARMGGDEFVICLPKLNQCSDVSIVVQKIQSALAQPVQIDAHNVQIGSSIGISMYPHNGDSVEALMQAADEAMYAAKAAGGGGCRFQPVTADTGEQAGNGLHDGITAVR